VKNFCITLCDIRQSKKQVSYVMIDFTLIPENYNQFRLKNKHFEEWQKFTNSLCFLRVFNWFTIILYINHWKVFKVFFLFTYFSDTPNRTAFRAFQHTRFLRVAVAKVKKF